MAWELIAESSSPEALEDSAYIDSVPHGSVLRLDISTYPYPVAPLANVWGMEWVAQRLLDADAEITDVRSDGWYTVSVYMRTNTHLFLILAAIAAILIGTYLIIHEITVWKYGTGGGLGWTDAVKWGTIGVLGLLGVMIIKEVRQ